MGNVNVSHDIVEIFYKLYQKVIVSQEIVEVFYKLPPKVTMSSYIIEVFYSSEDIERPLRTSGPYGQTTNN